MLKRLPAARSTLIGLGVSLALSSIVGDAAILATMARLSAGTQFEIALQNWRESVEKLLGRARALGLVLPDSRIVEKRTHHRLLRKQGQRAEQRQSRREEVKHGEQIQMIAVDCALARACSWTRPATLERSKNAW